ncbi:MAG: LytTR family DNA-binding domain-containing protein [Sphingobacterium sp.]|jgi:DNA-binding LytR/AlgR family response regulator|nr:LytTR family DNA-binding domain-containing protein [Sphingobacterium sp.]
MMNKLSCIIADDEPIARKILREFIADIHFLQLLAEFENTQKLDQWLKENKADILFLDIEMPQKTGIQYLRQNEIKPLVILTTAYPEYALEGYDLDVLDYLLKPISFKRFLKAVLKAKEYLEMGRTEGMAPSFLFVRCEKKIEKIDFDDIRYIESAGNYVYIHLSEKKIMPYLTLKSIAEQLPATEFVRTHQSFLVALSKIDSIENNIIWVKDRQIPIGRNYRESLLQRIERYILKRNN